MVDLRREKAHIRIIDSPTTVDCAREVCLRRTLRSLIQCILPYCCSHEPPPPPPPPFDLNDVVSVSSSSSSDRSSGIIITGTFFGHRRGRVSFCLQEDTRASSSPLLLLELAVPTTALAREMDQGLLRLALECDRQSKRSIFQVPVWNMFCNGRKVGFAVRRNVTAKDVGFLRVMQSVSVGAGVLPVGSNGGDEEEEMLYLRAKFERVTGSSDSESFHMINPGGSYGQELSIFLLRS